mgnify:CR=1 FL=1
MSVVCNLRVFIKKGKHPTDGSLFPHYLIYKKKNRKQYYASPQVPKDLEKIRVVWSVGSRVRVWTPYAQNRERI